MEAKRFPNGRRNRRKEVFMAISGINGTANYQTIYKNNKTINNDNKFKEQLNAVSNYQTDSSNEKSFYEKAFENIGATAPESVKKAWLEATEEIGTDGTGTLKNGMMSHISQLTVQMAVKRFNGQADYSNILGNSVKSAIQTVQNALYNLEHSIAYTPKSIEVQQARIKEKEFYVAFLDKLQNM